MNTSGINSETLLSIKSVVTLNSTDSGLLTKTIIMVCSFASDQAFNVMADKVRTLAQTQNGMELSRTHTINTAEMTSNIVLVYGFNDFNFGEWFKDRVYIALGVNPQTYTYVEL